MINKDTIIKILIASSPILAGGSLLLAGYLHKPESIDLSRDEYLNAMKSTRVWTEKDTQELLDKLEEFNKDLCKTYEILYTIVPTEEAIRQAKTIDQIPQLRLYRKLASELEKKEWGILPIIVAVDSAYTYPLFVEVQDPSSTSTMKIRSVYSEPWLANLLWNMRVYTQILPKCRKYFDEKTIRAFEISAEPPPEHRPNSDNNNQTNSQQQNAQQNTNNNTSSNTPSINNTNNANNSNSSINQNQNKSKNTQTIVKHTIKNQDNFDEEFRRRKEEFEKERRKFEEEFNKEWERFNQEFNNQQQHH